MKRRAISKNIKNKKQAGTNTIAPHVVDENEVASSVSGSTQADSASDGDRSGTRCHARAKDDHRHAHVHEDDAALATEGEQILQQRLQEDFNVKVDAKSARFLDHDAHAD